MKKSLPSIIGIALCIIGLMGQQSNQAPAAVLMDCRGEFKLTSQSELITNDGGLVTSNYFAVLIWKDQKTNRVDLATADVTPNFAGWVAPTNGETDLSRAVRKRDGTNYLGTFVGMIAEQDGCTKHYNAASNTMYGNFPQGVMMFSATSGEMLKWIPRQDFIDIFVNKTKPEYPK